MGFFFFQFQIMSAYICRSVGRFVKRQTPDKMDGLM